MPHNDYVREDGQWPPETVPTARDLALFDRAQSQGLRMAQTNTLSEPLIIGGAGVRFTGQGHLLSGGLRTESDGRLVLGDSDFPLLGTPRSRTILVVLGASMRASHPDNAGNYELSTDPFGVRIKRSLNGDPLYTAVDPYDLHDGATLSSATLCFRVGVAHAGIPGFLPRFTIGRYPVGTGTPQYLTADGSVTSGGGAALATPANASAYFAAGAPQTIELAFTQNAVIDASAYTYEIEIADETSTNSLPGNIFHSVALHFTGIATARFA
jgi:hypothetical protein